MAMRGADTEVATVMVDDHHYKLRFYQLDDYKYRVEYKGSTQEVLIFTVDHLSGDDMMGHIPWTFV